MCSDHNSYSCNSSYSPKRAKDELSGIIKLIIFIVCLVFLLVVFSFFQELYNDFANFIMNLF